MQDDNQNSPFAAAVRAAQPRLEIQHAVHSLYDSLQSRIDLRKPRCVASGECCRFDSYGHRLYVTTLETAVFLADLETHPSVDRKPGGRSLHVLTDATDACRFQIDGLCGVHAIRPFGCRIFFCDPTAIAWQHENYELFHQELKQLHQQLDVPYFYVEWRSALAQVL